MGGGAGPRQGTAGSGTPEMARNACKRKCHLMLRQVPAASLWAWSSAVPAQGVSCSVPSPPPSPWMSTRGRNSGSVSWGAGQASGPCWEEKEVAPSATGDATCCLCPALGFALGFILAQGSCAPGGEKFVVKCNVAFGQARGTA